MWNCIFFLSKRSNCSNGPERLLKINFTQEKKRKTLEDFVDYCIRVSCICSCISPHKYQTMDKEDYREFLHAWFYYRIASWTEFASILGRLTCIYFINKWMEGRKGNSITRKKTLRYFNTKILHQLHKLVLPGSLCILSTANFLFSHTYPCVMLTWLDSAVEAYKTEILFFFSWIKMKTKGI